MSGELTRWLATTPSERDRDRAVARVRSEAAAAQTLALGVTQVAQTALGGMLGVSMTKREACLLVPEDAAKFDLIATHAAMGCAMVISDLASR